MRDSGAKYVTAWMVSMCHHSARGNSSAMFRNPLPASVTPTMMPAAACHDRTTLVNRLERQLVDRHRWALQIVGHVDCPLLEWGEMAEESVDAGDTT